MIETIESDFIHEGNTSNFSSLVIDNSRTGPVLVNFWSRKAGPCLRQYPILDKLIHDYNGRLLLINIDTEKEIKISKEFGIASVPTLKLFRFEDVQVTLHGYQSETDLKNSIDKFVVRDSDKIIALAIQEYTNGDKDKTYQMLSNAIVEDQINPRLPLTICKLLQYEKKYDEALTLLDSLPLELKNDTDITTLSNQLFFMSDRYDINDIEKLIAIGKKDKDNLENIKKLSSYYVIEKQYEPALLELKKMIEIKFDFEAGYARIAMLKIFSLLGEDNDLVHKYRPLLAKFTH